MFLKKTIQEKGPVIKSMTLKAWKDWRWNRRQKFSIYPEKCHLWMYEKQFSTHPNFLREAYLVAEHYLFCWNFHQVGSENWKESASSHCSSVPDVHPCWSGGHLMWPTAGTLPSMASNILWRADTSLLVCLFCTRSFQFLTKFFPNRIFLSVRA